jgi:hypothetical protein
MCCSLRTITWSSRLRRQLPTHRSAILFCHGLLNEIRLGLLPMAFTAAIASPPNC